MLSPVRRFGLGLALLLLIGGPLISLAYAHAELVRALPADRCDSPCPGGTVLDSPPTSLHLWFSEPVQTVRHGLSVISPSGQEVVTGPLQSTGTELQAALNATEPGTYRVYWQVISEDTHPVRGTYLFSVGQTSPPPAGSGFSSSSSELGNISGPGLVLQALAHWLHVTGYALVFGLISFSRLVLNRANLPVPQIEKATAKLWRLVNMGLLGLLMAEPLALFGQTASLRPAQIFDFDLAGDILSSSYGRVVAQRLGLTLLAWVLVGPARQGSVAARRGLLGWGILLALVDGQASHAVTSGPLWLGLPSNTLHLVAVALWLGGLVGLLVTLPVVWGEGNWRGLVGRFGRLAAVCLFWIILTGSLMTGIHLNSPLNLINTAYGGLISLKMVAVIIAGDLALLGTQRSRQATQPSRRWWTAELGLLAFVLALAAVLITLAPPA